MSNEPVALPLRDRLSGLAAFLPTFQAPGFEFGRWGGGERTESGAIVMPYFIPGDEASAFVQATYDLGWVLEDFDWPAWKETPEAIQLRNDPGALAVASPDQLARLLMVCIRQERLVEGDLAGTFEFPLLAAMLAPADVLAKGAAL